MSGRYVDAVVLSDCFSHFFYVFDTLDAFVLATSSEPDMNHEDKGRTVLCSFF